MILLVCDKPKRELKALKQLSNQLKIKGIKSLIINKHLLIKAYNYYKPKIITIPHCKGYLKNPIKKLHKYVKLVLIPTEHSMLQDKFIDIQYFGVDNLNHREHIINKLYQVYVQSDYVKKYLNKKKVKNLETTGHLFYSYWDSPILNYKNSKKNIGIAITNRPSIRHFKYNNYLKVLKKTNEINNFVINPWKMGLLSLDIFYYFLLFKIIENLKDDYIVNIRPHPMDTETNWNNIFDYKNVNISEDENIVDWIDKQDIVLSTFSSICMDAYLRYKPHVSLIKLIPKNLLKFRAYNEFSWSEYYEWNSIKPSSIKQLTEIIKKNKFKKNKIIESKINKYFGYPYKKNPCDIISNNLKKNYMTKEKKFKFIKHNSFIENFLGSGIFLFLSEIKFYFDLYNQDSFFSKKTKFLFFVPRKILIFFNNLFGSK